MVTVAVAGGTGAVGRSRPEEGTALVPTFQVDYSDVDALQAFLEEMDVHTVISAFGITTTSLGTSQLNLVRAAEQSSATRRFIPSSSAIRYPEERRGGVAPEQPTTSQGRTTYNPLSGVKILPLTARDMLEKYWKA
ncbi:thiF family protein [Colletotrichum tofieldiae]|nr:ThiF family protein [Colletotrichum tofieldiae]GKT69717.1 thiF family protein [Colletotrichum tofieldiae]GKT92729.1 thiF family protein [Colletotrichum tofieldiae]